MYREHKPWKSRDGSARGHEERLKVWLDARRPVWEGAQEAYILGDINLIWKRQGDPTYMHSRMLKNLERELADVGWTQTVKRNTHYSNRNGNILESLIDNI